jgi:hypothetical protein
MSMSGMPAATPTHGCRWSRRCIWRAVNRGHAVPGRHAGNGCQPFRAGQAILRRGKLPVRSVQRETTPVVVVEIKLVDRDGWG